MSAPRDRWELLEDVTTRLEDAGVPTPDVDARLLVEALEERFGDLSRCDVAVLDGLVQRRAAREPLQVVLGRTTFRWVDLEVAPDVFVPRPETEVVAGLAVEACTDRHRPVVLEPCTGSGAIACALLVEVPGVRVVATDVDAAAVALARRNVARVGGGLASPPAWRATDGAEVEVLQGDLLAPVDPQLRGRVDVLVSNPPYLPAADVTALEPEVAGHDPHAALFGGRDGHEVVDALLAVAGTWLRPGGTVVLEIDDRRGAEAAGRAAGHGLVDVRVVPDLTGRDRAVVARRPD